MRASSLNVCVRYGESYSQALFFIVPGTSTVLCIHCHLSLRCGTEPPCCHVACLACSSSESSQEVLGYPSHPFPGPKFHFASGVCSTLAHDLISGMREEDRETTHEISLETRRETRAWQWLLSLSESLLTTFCRRTGIELRQTSKESYL